MISKLLSGRQSKMFVLMFTIVLLLNINFAMLRSIRSTLVVADLGGSAKFIPFYELFGTLPGAILMTFLLVRLLNRYSLLKVFYITIATFLGILLVLTLAVYPSLGTMRAAILESGLQYKEMLSAVLINGFTLVFYVIAELWKVALITILFWGLVNQYIPLNDAKTLYAPLMFAGSLGAIVTGPLISFCSSDVAWKIFSFSSDSWTHSLMSMIVVLSIIGAVTAWLYHLLWKNLLHTGTRKEVSESDEVGEKLSLLQSIKTCFKNKYLLLMAWIVLVDYIAYSLGEVIFLDILKEKFPHPKDYCNWMGILSFWSGIMTAVGAIVISPWILRNCRWIVAALATPICLLATECAFFFFLRLNADVQAWFGWDRTQWLTVIVMLGSLQYALCRAAKYALFDSSKEIAFVLLPPAEKMEGKLVIDGICARLGRGSASAISIGMISLFGGVIASAWATGLIAIGLTCSWIYSAVLLGRKVDKRTAMRENS